MKIAGQSPMGQVLFDLLSKKEQQEKDHILKEGIDAENNFKRKHFRTL
jgi:hypothetical protein